MNNVSSVQCSSAVNTMKVKPTGIFGKIQQYKYRNLADVRSCPSLSRKEKRIIHYIKYLCLGVLKPKKSYYSVTYSPGSSPLGGVQTPKVENVPPPFEVEVISSIKPFQDDAKDSVQPIQRVVLNDAHIKQMEHMFIAYKKLGYNGVSVKSEMGSELPFAIKEELREYCETRGIREPELRYTKLLVGGNPPRRKKRGRAKKKFKAQPNRSLVHGAQLGLRNPAQMTMYPPTVNDLWRYQDILSTDGSGNVSAYLSLRNPTTALNGSGVYDRAQKFALLYDEYKILSFTIVVDFLYLNPQQGDVAVATDYDTIPTGTYTINDLKDNQYLRMFGSTNQISYSTKVPSLSAGSYRGQPAVIHQGGYYDFNSPPDEGAMVLAFERFTPGVRIARITSTIHVKMRRRRTLPTADERENKRKTAKN